MDTRVVRVQRAPPKRLLAISRWRSFKMGPDHQVWEQCLEPVARLIDEGWELARVHVRWQRGLPYGVERQTRYLVWCVDECELTEDTGYQSYTEFTFTKDGAE
jgi:hypothetical protein